LKFAPDSTHFGLCSKMGSRRNYEHVMDSIVNSPTPNIGPLFCLTTVTSHLAYELHHAMNVFMRCDVYLWHNGKHFQHLC